MWNILIHLLKAAYSSRRTRDRPPKNLETGQFNSAAECCCTPSMLCLTAPPWQPARLVTVSVISAERRQERTRATCVSGQQISALAQPCSVSMCNIYCLFKNKDFKYACTRFVEPAALFVCIHCHEWIWLWTWLSACSQMMTVSPFWAFGLRRPSLLVKRRWHLPLLLLPLPWRPHQGSRALANRTQERMATSWLAGRTLSWWGQTAVYSIRSIKSKEAKFNELPTFIYLRF